MVRSLILLVGEASSRAVVDIILLPLRQEALLHRLRLALDEANGVRMVAVVGWVSGTRLPTRTDVEALARFVEGGQFDELDVMSLVTAVDLRAVVSRIDEISRTVCTLESAGDTDGATPAAGARL